MICSPTFNRESGFDGQENTCLCGDDENRYPGFSCESGYEKPAKRDRAIGKRIRQLCSEVFEGRRAGASR
jgi:hypothetical protein